MALRRVSPLLLQMLLVGCFAIASQILLIRETLTVFYGNEICIGVFFAWWFLWICLGARLGAGAGLNGGSEGDFGSRGGRESSTFLGLQVVMAVALPLQVTAFRSVRGILSLEAGEFVPFVPMFLTLGLILFPVSFCVGMVFPISSGLYATRPGGSAGRIGHIYALESLGSVIGGLLVSFAIAGRIGPLQAAALFALVLSAGCVLAATTMYRESRLGMAFFSLFVAGAAAFLLFSAHGRALENALTRKRWADLGQAGKLVASMDTKYQHLDLSSFTGEYTLYANGHVATTFPDPFNARLRAHLAMNEHPSPRRVLVIGGGLGGLLEEMLTYGPEQIDYAEIDAEAIELVRSYLPDETLELLSDPNLRVYAMDGRYFVKRAPRGYYDLVLLEIPDPSTAMLNRFYTREFMEELAEILSLRGVVGLSVTGTEQYMGPEGQEYVSSVYRTVTKVFPEAVTISGETIRIFASRHPAVVTEDPQELATRFRDQAPEGTEFVPELFTFLLPPGRAAAVREALEEYPATDTNTDDRPISYFLNTVYWNRWTESGIGGILSLWQRTTPKCLALTILVICLLGVLMLRWGSRLPSVRDARGALWVTSIAGGAGMSLELVLIFAFQNAYGYAYREIGLIVALFMVGLVLGGGVGSLIAEASDLFSRVRLVGLLVILALVSLVVPGLASYLSAGQGGTIATTLFGVTVVLTGWVLGMIFPSAAALHLSALPSVHQAAGKVDSADHIGAAVGALIAGSLLIPTMGIRTTCHLLALTTFLGALVLAISPVSLRAAPRRLPEHRRRKWR